MQKKRFSAVKRPIYIVCENEKGYTFFENFFANFFKAVVGDGCDWGISLLSKQKKSVCDSGRDHPPAKFAVIY